MQKILIDLSAIKIRIEDAIKERERSFTGNSYDKSRIDVLKAALEDLNNAAQNIHIFLNS